MRILLQFPEGLKKEALERQRKLEKKGHEVFVSASPCFGACDLAVEEGKLVKADKLIHFGHSEFVKKKLPFKVEYEHYKQDAPLEVVFKALQQLGKYEKIGLATTIQHAHQLPGIRKILEGRGKKVFIGKGSDRVKKGQVLGCDYSAVNSIEDKVDCIFFFGGGNFHSYGFRVEKQFYQLDPYLNVVLPLNDEIEKQKKKERGNMIKAAAGRKFGILVSTKIGQANLKLAKKAKKQIEGKNREASILVTNQIMPEALQNFNIFDAYINTACPRIAEDYENIGKPVVNIYLLNELIKIM